METGVRSPTVKHGGLYGYLWSDNIRRVQTVLGLFWLLDGALQFQSFMYSRGFPQMLIGMAEGQPTWLHDSMVWAAKVENGAPSIWNTLFALTQVTIGLGILYRPTVKPALVLSFGWALIVWWFGEGFGMLFMLMAQPLTGAPGAVLLYALIGMIVWPNGRAGGLVGVRGAKTIWAALWIATAWLWLQPQNSAAGAVHDAVTATDSGIGWVNSLQTSLADATRGDGLAIALVLAAISAAIGIAVAADWHPKSFLDASIVLSVIYWVVPQGFGGIFAGGATDLNSGPLFVLLACSMYPLASSRASVRHNQESPGPASAPAVSSHG